MRRAILIASAVVLSLAATAAFASLPLQVNWSDDFETHAVGAHLHDYGYPWSPAGAIPNYTIQLDGTNKIVQTGNNGGVNWEWCETILGNQATAPVQFLHFKAKSVNPIGDTRFRDSVAVTNGGVEIARWQFNAGQFKSRITAAGHNGPATAYNDGAWHDFDMTWTVGGATIDYYFDGGLYQSVATTQTSLVIMNFEFWGNSWYDNIGWMYDDVVVGTMTIIPEPASLLALSTFVIGAFGFVRRRRA